MFNSIHTMTYSAYGYCSWECLMNHKKRYTSPNRVSRKGYGNRQSYGHRSKWA